VFLVNSELLSLNRRNSNAGGEESTSRDLPEHMEDPARASHQERKLNVVVHIMVAVAALSSMIKAIMTNIMSEESWSLLCTLPCVRIRFCILRKALYRHVA
jgi:hypothetical protein